MHGSQYLVTLQTLLASQPQLPNTQHPHVSLPSNAKASEALGALFTNGISYCDRSLFQGCQLLSCNIDTFDMSALPNPGPIKSQDFTAISNQHGFFLDLFNSMQNHDSIPDWDLQKTTELFSYLC